jgi:small subunit ribosomal protein S19
MTRSLHKGPYVDERVLKKVLGKRPEETGVIKTWIRRSDISPEMVGFTFGIYNGKTHIEVLINEDMVGHKLGEFSPTRKFTRHGGKMQKEIDQKKKESEISAAKTAKATVDTKKK